MAYPQHSKLSRENSVGEPMETTGRVRVLLIGRLKDFRNSYRVARTTIRSDCAEYGMRGNLF